MRYAVVIEKATNNYSAYVPDLPGCIATGKTVEEAEKLIREAIELHLTGLREGGRRSHNRQVRSNISRWPHDHRRFSVISRSRSRLRARQQLG
jgi:predicted RNase H-like HicB family nuclease